jgi:hypothetical protein
LPNHIKVIRFRLSGWKFFDYPDEIEKWYRGLSEEGQYIFNTILKVNQKAELPTQWVNCKALQGGPKEQSIWEWHFLADGRQERLLGIFGELRREAIFLIGCSHKQKVYQPANCLETAIKRAKEVRGRKVTLYERTVEPDI